MRGTRAAPRAGRVAVWLLAAALSACAGLPAGPGLPDNRDAPALPSAEAATPAQAAPALPATAPAADVTHAAPAASEAPDPAAVAVEAAAPGVRPRLDPEQDADRGDLWQRVRDGFAIADIDQPLVRKWERHYAERPDYVQRMMARGSRYLFHIVEQVQRRGLPTELALLPFIESAYNPQAQSRAKASGMWQFMPATGRDFELTQNVFRDDRRHVLASTEAALDYLSQLHVQFGDWPLALAAYNWGPGNVQRAIQRNLRARKPAQLDALRMPAETRNYVPKLQAMKNIVARPQDFGLSVPPLHNRPYFTSVAIERDIDVERVAALAGLPLEEFQWLNPQLNKPVILAAGTPQVLLPYDAANRFVQALPQVTEPLASWTAWVAPRTLRPAEAATLLGIGEAELRDVNQIPPRMLVKAGSTLVVPRGEHVTDDVAGHIADGAVMALAREGRPPRRVTFKAGRQGDTVQAVARRYRVSSAEVLSWNPKAARGGFRPGQTVVVMLAPAERRTVRGTGRAAAPAAGKAAARAGIAAPARLVRR